MPNQPKPLGAWVRPSLSALGSCFPLPLGGGRGNDVIASYLKKKDEDASTLPDLFRLVFPPLSLYLLRCLQMHRGLLQIRELQLLRLNVGNGRTRCYFLAELYLLFKMD